MVKQSMRDDGEEGGSSDGDNSPYEPKLTRAKTKLVSCIFNYYFNDSPRFDPENFL